MTSRKPNTPSLVIASRNRKKAAEIADLLQPHGIEVISVADFPDVPEVIEDGRSFAENAAIKASQTARHLAQWVLGEDSGLMVDALGGAPGIYSARYSGEGATDDSNNRKLIDALAAVPDEQRTAQYVCRVAVADPSGQVRLEAEGVCRGRIVRAERGANGFGYDPYFLIPEYHRTFGELSPLVKRQLSHRGRALRRLVGQLARIFDNREEGRP
jgi:XTP/dITP diphosphohydrolase